MYTPLMRRIQIYIDEEVDDALRAEAARSGRSKAALIRECVSERIARSESQEDPLTALVGSVDADPVDDIDEVIYGR